MDLMWGNGDARVVNFLLEIELIFLDFMEDERMAQYNFPPTLDHRQRMYVHEKCVEYGIKSKLIGREPTRYLCIYKTEAADVGECHELQLSPAAANAMSALLRENPGIERNRVDAYDNFERCTFGKLNIGDAELPEVAANNPFVDTRKSLEIYRHRQIFLDMVERNQIVVVCAEPGSGKTTQIPQYLLEYAVMKGEKCRVISVQPKRITALSASLRVAAERGEEVGISVGYQIKLESKLGPRTGIVFCTTDILLRTLMTGESCFRGMTHVVIDEIQERDKFTDFLLVCLRECLTRHPALRIVLLSSNEEGESYRRYFDKKVDVLKVPRRSVNVGEFYLEDVLSMINYECEAMGHSKDVGNNTSSQAAHQLDHATVEEMQEALHDCMRFGTKENFAHLMRVMICKNVPVNFADPMFGYTALIVAAAHGNLVYMRKLIIMGADLFITSLNGRSALSWAKHYRRTESAAFLVKHIQEGTLVGEQSLFKYKASVLDETIDHDLIVAIVQFIRQCVGQRGCILVFLPGYEDIANCAEKINEKLNASLFHVCTLHDAMSLELQKEVYVEVPDKQKIVLATDIAEAIVTVDHVQFVIDTAYENKVDYDAITGTSALTKKWISKSSVQRRANRAGHFNNGMCFHLFTRAQYEDFAVDNLPEMRCVPLHELCLQTKMLVPDDVPISDFLSRAIDPPSASSVNDAIESLVALGALNRKEELTTMGKHLVQFSVEPNLGKMLLYATVFKCLDPVLTIVACMSHKDPFVLPAKAELKMEATLKKKALGGGSLSDHMCLLICFQMWQDAKVHSREQSFCSQHFISSAAMSTINNIRMQLLGQLRASGFVPAQPRSAIFDLNVNSENWGVVKAAIAAGMYPSVAYSEDGQLYTSTQSKVEIHPSSSLRNSICDSKNVNDDAPNLWIMFGEMSKMGGSCKIKTCTAVSSMTICMIGGRAPSYDPTTRLLTIDETMSFRVPTIDAVRFRTVLSEMIDRKIRNARARPLKTDESVLQTFVAIMSAEEQMRGLIHPPGIGNRPKIVYPSRFELKSLNTPESNSSGNSVVNFGATESNSNGNGVVNFGATESNSNGNSVVNFGATESNSNGNSVVNFGATESNSNGNGVVNFGATSSLDESNHESYFHKEFGIRSYNLQENVKSLWSLFDEEFEDELPLWEAPHNVPTSGVIGHPFYKQNEYPGKDMARGAHCNLQENNETVQPRPRPGPSSASSDSGGDMQLLTNVIAPKYTEIPDNALFFIIKPKEMRNIIISLSQSTWKFSPQTEKKLFKWFNEGFAIFLLYTVRGTKSFQGVAQLLGTNNGVPNNPCPIEWLGTNPVPYDRIKHIIHPKIHIREDGQELNACAGRIVARMLMENPLPHGDSSRPVLGAR